MEITLSGNNKKALKLIEKLAIELGLKISKREQPQSIKAINESNALYDLMMQMIASDGVASIQNPIKWQNQVREDKTLYGRE